MRWNAAFFNILNFWRKIFSGVPTSRRTKRGTRWPTSWSNGSGNIGEEHFLHFFFWWTAFHEKLEQVRPDITVTPCGPTSVIQPSSAVSGLYGRGQPCLEQQKSGHKLSSLATGYWKHGATLAMMWSSRVPIRPGYRTRLMPPKTTCFGSTKMQSVMTMCIREMMQCVITVQIQALGTLVFLQDLQKSVSFKVDCLTHHITISDILTRNALHFLFWTATCFQVILTHAMIVTPTLHECFWIQKNTHTHKKIDHYKEYLMNY